MSEPASKPNRRRLIIWGIVIVVVVGFLALALADSGDDAATAGGETPMSDTDQSQALDGWLRGFYGIEEWADFETSEPGLVWQRTVEQVEVDRSRAIIHLEINPQNPDTPRLGDEAATTVAQQIRANNPDEADGVSIVQAVDASGTVIGNERLG